MNKSATKTVLFEIAGVEGEVTVEFDFSPGLPMSMYGGPDHLGWPEEPPELEVTAIYFGKLEVLEQFSEEQVTAIEDAILEEGPDEGADDR